MFMSIDQHPIYLSINIFFGLQICHEFERFSTYLPDIKVAVFYGGVSIKIHKDLLKNECPHIVVGTPGRILALARDKELSLRNVRHFILDECDKMLESLGELCHDNRLIFSSRLEGKCAIGLLITCLIQNQICGEMCKRSSR